MSTTIYYFSATGNSLFIAKEIAQKLGETELVAINSLLNQRNISSNSDIVGFIFPVYFFGLPILVSDFIKRYSPKKGQYCFALAIHGGESGNALYQIRKECTTAKIKLSYARDIEVCGAWIVLYKPQEPEFFDYNNELRAKVRLIANELTVRKTYIDDIRYRPFLSIIYKVGFKRLAKADKYFTVDCNCDGCGVCERICPVGNIIIDNNTPLWQHKCQHCMACIHWCSKESIQYTRATVGKNRYRNPFISVNELITVIQVKNKK